MGAGSSACPGTLGAGPGGYTYGDIGKINGFPEVHADGEIFAQTLWDLRATIGVDAARTVVTRAMELSPDNPSFLDMRNAIIQADVVNHGAQHVDEIWQVFTQRGMGYFAGSAGTADTKPAEDFSLPPSPGSPTATLSGTVTDPLSGEPLPGVAVAIAGLDSGFIPDHAALTDAAGQYSIPDVVVGTYPKVTATLPGWEHAEVEVTVSAPSTMQNFVIRRDWVPSAGGAIVTETNGDEFDALGCGARAAIDQSQGTAWSPAVEPDATGNVTPKFVGVRYVRVTLLGPRIDLATQCAPPQGTGCFFMDLAEVAVYGVP